MTGTAPEAETRTEAGFIRSHGLRFPSDPRFIRGPARKALRQGTYEMKETEAALRVVRRRDTVLELGAGIGYMSALLARKVAVRQVHAFEANPALIPYIEEVHRLNGITNVAVHHALLAPTAGPPATFYVRRNFLASSLSPEPSDGVIETVEVPVRDFSQSLAELSPTVLVCDIEGAEADLLPAADLSCLRAAIVETHPQWIGQAGVQAVFDAMHRAGLTYFPKASNGKVVCFRKGW